MQPLIDTHVHFDDNRFDHDRDEVFQRAGNNGVAAMIVPAVTRARWSLVENVALQYKNVFPAAGLHPVFCNQHQRTDLDLLDKKLAAKNCIAVGECGLDGTLSNTTVQKFYFNAQIELARQYTLPLIIHARNAVEDVILLLRKHQLCNAAGNGVVHSYNGSLHQARRLIDLGYLLSFGGPVTNPGAHKPHTLVKGLPLESIMLETDAPDQTVAKYRGMRNEPAYITEVLQSIAALRDEDANKIASVCNANAQRLFNLPEFN